MAWITVETCAIIASKLAEQTAALQIALVALFVLYLVVFLTLLSVSDDKKKYARFLEETNQLDRFHKWKQSKKL